MSLLTIATWNVNSIKSRMHQAVPWLESAAPDVVLLQELKCMDDAFPLMEIESLGYNVVTHGQKTYNGVAILSKHPIDDVVKGIPIYNNAPSLGGSSHEQVASDEAGGVGGENNPSRIGHANAEPSAALPQGEGNSINEQARYIEALITPEGSEALRVASVYVPNGNEIGSEKFAYKLNFFEKLTAHLKSLQQFEEMVVIGGDYNVAPQDGDVYDPKQLEGTVCFHPDERAAFRRIEHMGYLDAYRLKHPLPMGNDDYTWWDYRGGAFAKGSGLRIDHLLLSPQAADHLVNCEVHRDLRGQEKPSDHVPVVASFNL